LVHAHLNVGTQLAKSWFLVEGALLLVERQITVRLHPLLQMLLILSGVRGELVRLTAWRAARALLRRRSFAHHGRRAPLRLLESAMAVGRRRYSLEDHEGDCRDGCMADVPVRTRKQGPGFRRAGHRGGRLVGCRRLPELV
jgi:hypothetical protein